MTQGVLYMVDGGELKRMCASAPENEDRMQYLVARYPELITDGDGDLLLISRESAIGDGEVTGRWSLDHLFVTRQAVPVLVELKRASDTRIRREVVGQLIDYAANATAHWAAGTIAGSFANTAGADRADALLAAFIGDREPDDFWAQVDANLKAGRIKLVFVADVIPRELAIVVEFLNAQMRADVRAVELRWFSDGAGLTTLSPRVIGETEQAAISKATGATRVPISVGQWIQDRLSPLGEDTARAAERFVTLIERADGEVVVPSTQGSIIARFAVGNGSFAYPLSISPNGMLKLLLAYLINRPAFADERSRADLYQRLAALVGPLHTNSLAGEPGFRASLLLDPAIETGVSELVRNIVDLIRGVETYPI
ncbi:MAG: hypothetical protein JSR79_00080 [Proteobacteria bacterium]|nr:hypothetical protein [Pseudomonadota bacterium]